MSQYKLHGAVVPEVSGVVSGCDTSFVEVVFSDAKHFTLNLVAITDLPSPPIGQKAIARVIVSRVDDGDVVWVFETNQFLIAGEVEVDLNPLASTVGGAPFIGSANLTFSETQFTFMAKAKLKKAPNLPPSDGQVFMNIDYMLIMYEPTLVKSYEGSMDVTLLPLPTPSDLASFGYQMQSSQLSGLLMISNFAFPFGAKHARGHVSLAGDGFSLDWPFIFAVDPYQNARGETLYPANLQMTTGFGVNFTANVLPCTECPTSSTVLSGSFVGFVTAGLVQLAVPNYVASVSGTIDITSGR